MVAMVKCKRTDNSATNQLTVVVNSQTSQLAVFAVGELT